MRTILDRSLRTAAVCAVAFLAVSEMTRPSDRTPASRLAAVAGHDDLRGIVERLDGPDFATREAATEDLRRAMIERTLELFRVTGGASPEARARVQVVADDLASLARLLPALAQVSAADQNELIEFFSVHRAWTLDALSNDSARVETALADPPAGGELAVAIIYASLIADGSREVPQMIAIRRVPGELVPAVSGSLLAALTPLTDPPYFAEDIPMMHRLRGQRPRWELRVQSVLDAARRGGMPEAVGWTLAVMRELPSGVDRAFEAELLNTTRDLFRAEHAKELTIAARWRRETQSGGHSFNGVGTLAGDQALILAAHLIEMDVAALGIAVVPGRGEQPPMWGFADREQATASRIAIETAALERDGGPIAGLEEALLEIKGAKDRR